MIIYNIAVKTNLLTIYTNVHKLLMCGTTNASFHLLFVVKKLQLVRQWLESLCLLFRLQ